jgi:hypothetical protein
MSVLRSEKRSAKKKKIKSGKMPRNALTDVIPTLLHAVAAPHHRHHGRYGGRRHCRLVLTPAPISPPPPLVVPHRRVLERPSSPSLDGSAYQPLEPSDLDASPWDHRGRPCAVHDWGYTGQRVLVIEPSGGGGGKRRRRRQVLHHSDHRPCRASMIRRMARFSIRPWG